MSDKSVKKRDKWLNRIADEDKAHKVWRARAKDAEDEFCKYDDVDALNPPYALFATTINLIHGRIYGQPPKPDVRKRHPSSPLQPTPDTGQAPPGPPGQPPSVPGVPAPAPGQAPGMGPDPPGMGAPTGPQLQPGLQPPGMGGGPPPQGGGQLDPNAPPVQPAQFLQTAGLASGAATAVQPPMTSLALAPNSIADDNIISMALERCLSFTVDTTLFDRDAHMAVNDFLIAACGQVKVEIETEIEMVPVVNPLTGVAALDPEGQPLQKAQIVSQELHLRHFHHSQFRWEPCKDWRRVGWVSFDHYMTKDDIEDEFNVDIAENSNGPGSGTQDSEVNVKPPQMDKYEGVYTVHEIWDKKNKKRLYVSECYPDVLDEEDDPLELEDFYPCPPPMMANVNGRELVPNPDYWQYSSLCDQANVLAKRITSITKQVKDIGFYDTTFGELKKVNENNDGTYIAVNDLISKLRSMDGKASFDSVIIQLPMTDKVAVLGQLSQQLEVVKQRVYEINGISDIQRGVTNPGDTATAQNIKNEWADIRTGQRVQVVALFFRDIFRIMAEIIATKFERSQIEAMCGIALSDQQLAVMRSELATSYSVDVESDSTMTQNDSQNIAALTAFLGTLTPYLDKMLPAIKHGLMPADLGKEILAMIVDAYKPGRDLQQAVEALPSTLAQLNDLTTQAQQAQQQAQQAQQQVQQLTQQVQQLNAQKQQREDARASADIQEKGAKTQRTQAETSLIGADLPHNAALAQKVGAEAQQASAQAQIASRENTIQAIQTGIQ